ncbi:MAG: hypothetical protein MHMPM18_000707 [Marteilia pararefringens]
MIAKAEKTSQSSELESCSKSQENNERDSKEYSDLDEDEYYYQEIAKLQQQKKRLEREMKDIVEDRIGTSFSAHLPIATSSALRSMQQNLKELQAEKYRTDELDKSNKGKEAKKLETCNTYIQSTISYLKLFSPDSLHSSVESSRISSD